MWWKQRFAATRPGLLKMSDAKLAEFHPELYFLRAPIRNTLLRILATVSRFSYYPLSFPGQAIADIRQRLQEGDCRAAVVLSVSPLRVAAYSSDMDAVAILGFPDNLVLDYGLVAGSRLVTVNHYRQMLVTDSDIKPGPGSSGVFTSFMPLIGDFLTEDKSRLQVLKQQIDKDEWRRALELGTKRWHEQPNLCRSGLPRYAEFTASSTLRNIVITTVIVVPVIMIIAGYLIFF